jgi:hypothetical protein
MQNPMSKAEGYRREADNAPSWPGALARLFPKSIKSPCRYVVMAEEPLRRPDDFSCPARRDAQTSDGCPATRPTVKIGDAAIMACEAHAERPAGRAQVGPVHVGTRLFFARARRHPAQLSQLIKKSEQYQCRYSESLHYTAAAVSGTTTARKTARSRSRSLRSAKNCAR